MKTSKLKVIRGESPDTFTLGHERGKKRFRDARFAPEMSFMEAKWLLENETILAQRERKGPRERVWH